MAALRLLRRVRTDERGATIIEFAMVAPIMCMLLLGGFDVSHMLYTRAQLQGIVQKTARDGTLESDATEAASDALDAKVKKQALALQNDAKLEFKRRYYRNFTEAAAAKPEPWTDTNKNGTCDAGEPYQDNNLNSAWDKDGGNSGQGGAKDAVVYTVDMTFKRMFPIYKVVGGSDMATVSATTVLRNQPYDNQQSYGTAKVRNCT
jgi:Flp pilus assembly pilin Flp